jgi:hypothetical protein
LRWASASRPEAAETLLLSAPVVVVAEENFLTSAIVRSF